MAVTKPCPQGVPLRLFFYPCRTPLKDTISTCNLKWHNLMQPTQRMLHSRSPYHRMLCVEPKQLLISLSLASTIPNPARPTPKKSFYNPIFLVEKSTCTSEKTKRNTDK